MSARITSTTITTPSTGPGEPAFLTRRVASSLPVAAPPSALAAAPEALPGAVYAQPARSAYGSSSWIWWLLLAIVIGLVVIGLLVWWLSRYAGVGKPCTTDADCVSVCSDIQFPCNAVCNANGRCQVVPTECSVAGERWCPASRMCYDPEKFECTYYGLTPIAPMPPPPPSEEATHIPPHGPTGAAGLLAGGAAAATAAGIAAAKAARSTSAPYDGVLGTWMENRGWGAHPASHGKHSSHGSGHAGTGASSAAGAGAGASAGAGADGAGYYCDNAGYYWNQNSKQAQLDLATARWMVDFLLSIHQWCQMAPNAPQHSGAGADHVAGSQQQQQHHAWWYASRDGKLYRIDNQRNLQWQDAHGAWWKKGMANTWWLHDRDGSVLRRDGYGNVWKRDPSGHIWRQDAHGQWQQVAPCVGSAHMTTHAMQIDVDKARAILASIVPVGLPLPGMPNPCASACTVPASAYAAAHAEPAQQAQHAMPSDAGAACAPSCSSSSPSDPVVLFNPAVPFVPLEPVTVVPVYPTFF